MTQETWKERVDRATKIKGRPLTLKELITLAYGYNMTKEEIEAQRQSWARQMKD